MTKINIISGFATINGANIYYEIAGDGEPFVMIHAGVADSRQWDNEFIHFAKNYKVIRYDMRGYGKSEPVEGEFSHLADFNALLAYLKIQQPLILMGCSMGGNLAMDFVLSHPSRSKALIMVGSGPSGLELDIESPAEFDEAEKAYDAKNWDLVAEIETKIWFDGINRASHQVNQDMRKLAYDMNRIALSHEAKNLGKRIPNIDPKAVNRLNELHLPILVIVGNHDIPYILASADYMVSHIPSVKKVIIEDAAHLPNMDHPVEFQQAVSTFLMDNVN